MPKKADAPLLDTAEKPTVDVALEQLDEQLMEQPAAETAPGPIIPPVQHVAEAIGAELRTEFEALLTKARAKERPTLTPKDIDLATRLALIGGGGPKRRGAYQEEIEHYVHCIRRYQLDPMQRQICAVWRWDKNRNDEVMTVQTQIDGYRLIAQRTGEYAGNDDAEFTYDDNGNPVAAKVTVWRVVKGIRCPYSATARMQEYKPSGKGDWMWQRMPHGQLAKCAEALALRKGFPSDLSGLYVDVEMDQAGDIQPPANAPSADPAMPKTPPRDERNGITVEKVYREWLALAEPAMPEEKLHENKRRAGQLFGQYLSSLAGATIDNPRDCPQDILDAAEKDLDHGDPRPKDQRE